MAPRNVATIPGNGIRRVRARLLSALHVGRLRPGDRVLSVRRLADLTGINHKTVHRAYRTLAEEGILEVRPGSGTFVTERRSGAGGQPSATGLSRVIEVCRHEATRLGLAPEVFSRFVGNCLADGLHGVSVGLVECNWEQIAMIGQDLRGALNVQVKPVLLSTLERNPAESLDQVSSVVTTDCHYSQVVDLLEPYGLATYTVTLDQRFPSQLLELARQNEIIMVLQDRTFGTVLRRLLSQLGSDTNSVRRIRFVGERELDLVVREARPGTWIHFSRLLSSSVRQTIPRHLRQLKLSWRVDPTTLESLRAGLALDEALREIDSQGGAHRAPARAS